MKNQRLVAIGISRSGESKFTTRSEEKPIPPAEYSAEAFKKMRPAMYRDLVRCGMPSTSGVKITVMP